MQGNISQSSCVINVHNGHTSALLELPNKYIDCIEHNLLYVFVRIPKLPIRGTGTALAKTNPTLATPNRSARLQPSRDFGPKYFRRHSLESGDELSQ